mgnify:CR=1 FL=1
MIEYEPKKDPKVVFCMATLWRPVEATLDALEASIPHVEAAGWKHALVSEIACPYISAARSKLLRKAIDADATDIFFLDDDLSWEPEAPARLLQTKGDIVAGTYRFRQDEEAYMGTLYTTADGRPIVRPEDGAIIAEWVPAGFLRVTLNAVRKLMRRFPELVYGLPEKPHFDLFHHGAHNGLWYGEDYAFSRRAHEAGLQVVIVPDLSITHHDKRSGRKYGGNFHEFLLKQPGGSKA